MHKSIKLLAASILSFTAATAVQAQQPQWVQISTSANGDQVFFDLGSQVKVFEAGYKQNTFRTLMLELIAAFPPNKKFLLSRDTAIALADAERYFTIEQLADRLERMAGMPVSADRVVTLLEEMGYIVAIEDSEESITATKTARFFTRRVAGEMKWRANILQLLLWEYNWQMKNRKNGGRSV